MHVQVRKEVSPTIAEYSEIPLMIIWDTQSEKSYILYRSLLYPLPMAKLTFYYWKPHQFALCHWKLTPCIQNYHLEASKYRQIQICDASKVNLRANLLSCFFILLLLLTILTRSVGALAMRIILEPAAA